MLFHVSEVDGIVGRPKDPIGSSVRVGVANTSKDTQSGTLTVKAVLTDGSSAMSTETVTLSGHGEENVAVPFAGVVDYVISATINDEPDPIPL